MARRHTVKRDQLDRDLAAIQDIRDALKPIEGWRAGACTIVFVRDTWAARSYLRLREADRDQTII